MLSDKTIKKYIEEGKIKFYPQIEESNIRPVGVRLHLGSEVLVPTEGQSVAIGDKVELKYEKVAIDTNSFELKPGQFILGTTLESFQLDRSLVALIDGRSTIARLGLAIHCTSAIADGNFEDPRTIVLEIKNQGNFNLILKSGDPVAMLTFFRLSDEIGQHVQKQYKGQQGAIAPNLISQKE